jgi:hypothetical protein
MSLNPKGKDHLGNLGIDGRINYIYLKDVGLLYVTWNELPLDRVQWRDLGNKVMNLRAPQKATT